MCRMAAFPPGTTKKEALVVLENMSVGQNHGTGVAYVKDGGFVINKWAVPLAQVLAHKLPLLDHMPSASWTIVHMRQTSVGQPAKENSHPFAAGDWAFCHNGTWMAYRPVKALLEKLGHRFDGGTDSEVAAHLWGVLGPKGFMRAVGTGVWFALNKSGKLWAYCADGDLHYRKAGNKYLLASELPGECTEVETGWMHLGAKGTMIKSDYTKDPVVVRTYSNFRSTYVYPNYARPYDPGAVAGYRSAGLPARQDTLWPDEFDALDKDEPPLPKEMWDALTPAERDHYIQDLNEQAERENLARKAEEDRQWGAY